VPTIKIRSIIVGLDYAACRAQMYMGTEGRAR
jgi:hypothetical protein